ncbi:MAG: LysM peptidoglycan-binding domain-containing protein, partial [Mariprofundaceae bacterium]|nr:LysM peptidoglycan-binding domain-containing protein [Mariprofundaceae bacterium]
LPQISRRYLSSMQHTPNHPLTTTRRALPSFLILSGILLLSLTTLSACANRIQSGDAANTAANPHANNQNESPAAVAHPNLQSGLAEHGIAQSSPLASPNPLLEGLSPSDIARIQADAKRIYSKHWKRVSERSRYVRARILPILEEMKAPQELQLVPVAESGYNPYAFSRVGATGLWQVMPGTARVLGMKAPKGYDARRHVEASTRGGVQYLIDMHEIFGNWPVAFAAYHRGPGSMRKRLKRHPWTPQDGLDHLPVPAVTRTYVRGILGLSILVQRGVWQFPEPWETHQVAIDGPIDVTQLAKIAGIDRNEIYRFNPGLNHSQYLDRQITLNVPQSMLQPLMAKIELAAPAYVSTRVRRGDSLWVLARRYHTSVHNLKHLNPGIRKLLHPGQHLTVPAGNLNSAHPPLNPLLAQGRRIHYRVRSGDSLWRIAKRFGTSPSAIARANSIRTGKTIRPGDRLWVLASAGAS